MNKVYSYIRFSDPRQAEGDSYRRQLADTLAYCKKNTLQLVSDSDYMFFDKGISAYSGKLRDDNTELSRFLSLVQAGEIQPGSTLIVESLDRLSREHVRQALPRFIDLLNAGITIHTLHGNKTYPAYDYDQFDLFQSIMEMTRAYSESETKSKRIKSKWEEKQEQAKAGVPLGNTKPAWLDLVYDNGSTEKPYPKAKSVSYRVNDELAAVVHKIFQLTRDGYGRNAVARMLNEEGIPAFRTKQGWGASTINQILNNEAVLGLYQPYTKGDDGKRVKRGDPFMLYPPILDRATFDAAKAATAGRNAGKARQQSPEFQIWQGIAKCQLCGSALHTYGNGRKPKEGQSAPRWMRCYNAKKGKCEAESIAVPSMEPVFAEILAKLNILALVQTSASAINAKLDGVTTKLATERVKFADIAKDYAETRSLILRTLLLEAETTVLELEAQEKQLLSDLAADQIIDKADFFARLDLKSFPGRSRANSILKRLQVQVGINTDQRRFHVRKAGVPVLDLVDRGARGIMAYAANYEYSAVIQRQDGTFTPLLTDHDHEEQEYENEGYDSRDNPPPG